MELKLHDKITHGYSFTFGPRLVWEEPPPILEVLSFITKPDGEYVRVSKNEVIPRHIAEMMRETYLRYERAGQIVVLATDIDGNPIHWAIIE